MRPIARVVPVMDVRGGLVMHGIAGRREAYQPLLSPLTGSADPLALAHAFHDRLGLNELYLADLDALTGGTPDLRLYQALSGVVPELWVDAGLRTSADAGLLLDAGVSRVIAALESLAGPDSLAELARALGQRLIFSLDLRGGGLVTGGQGWANSVEGVARQAVDCGASRLLVLDVGRVGVGQGPGTETLCRQLAAAFPQVELIAGGGVRGRADLERLAECGVRAALVATALHSGQLEGCFSREFKLP